MKTQNKILLVEKDLRLAMETRLTLEKAGYEITAVVPYIFNVINSIESQKPDIIALDAYLTDQVADFVAEYVKLPLIIISDQYEKEIYKYSDKIRILSVIRKPYNIYEIKIPVEMAFNKL